MAGGKEFGRRSLEAQKRADAVLRAEGQDVDGEGSSGSGRWRGALHIAEVVVLVALAFGIVTFLTRGFSFGTYTAGGYAAATAASEKPGR